MQETQVQSLVQEEPTFRGATKPVRYNDGAFAVDLRSHNYCSLSTLGPVRHERSHHKERAKQHN